MQAVERLSVKFVKHYYKTRCWFDPKPLNSIKNGSTKLQFAP